MEQCNTTGCVRPAAVESTLYAPFSMSSTSTQSKRTVKVCIQCAEQEKRMKEFGGHTTLA